METSYVSKETIDINFTIGGDDHDQNMMWSFQDIIVGEGMEVQRMWVQASLHSSVMLNAMRWKSHKLE